MDELSLLRNERILQFKLSRDKSIIDDGYRALIMSSLYGKKSNSFENINTFIAELFIIKPIPSNILHKHLKDLIKEGKVLFKEGKYQLSKEQKKELLSITDKRTHIKKVFEEDYIKIVQKHFKKIKSKAPKNEHLLDIIDDVMSTYFTRSAKLFIAYIIEEETLTINIPELGKIVEEVLSERVRFKEVLNDSIIEAILNAPIITYEYFFDMFQVYVYFEILNIDPETQIKIKIDATYLDTNVLLDLLLPSRRARATTEEIIKLQDELNIKTYYTKKTSEELYNVIEDYKKLIGAKESILENMATNDSGGLIDAYFIEKKDNPSLTYEGYCLGLQKGFNKILLKKYKIEIDNSEYKEIEEGANKLYDIVNIYSVDITGKYKTHESIKHDAFNLQLQIIKNNSWFITRDRSLFYISKYLLDSKEITKPLSVISEVWLQALNFITPPLNNTNSVTAFREFLARPLVPTLRPINLNKLISVSFPWIKDEFLDAEDLADLISKKFIDEYIIKPQDKEKPILTFEDLVPKIIDEKLKQKLVILQKEKEEIENQMDNTIKEKIEIIMEGYKKVPKYEITIKPFFYIGIFCLVLLIASIVLSGLEILTVSDTVYYSLTSLIVIFIGASVFGESIFILLKRK